MTKLITRYFGDAAAAQEAKRQLVMNHRVSTRILQHFDKADGLADKLGYAGLDAETVDTATGHMKSGGAILLVRAGYKPLGVAKIFRQVTADLGGLAVGNEVNIKETTKPLQSILPDHPHMMTRPLDGSVYNPHMADWPIPLISKRKPFTGHVFHKHARMANWPIPLLSDRKPFTGSIVPRHGRMANFILPLLSDRKPNTASIFPRHARMANFILPLLSRRKPYTGSLIPRHQRMANWPFPHLINGKTGTNSLVPGGKRMANFPISLLSKRKPFTGSIVGRHARMASFPIPLLSKRKPYTGMAIEPHGRMANFILPLVIRRSEDPINHAGRGFSFSRMLGMRTIIHR